MSAPAAMWEFAGFIDSDQSDAPVPGGYLGGGFVSAILDTLTGDFEWFVAFGGLTGPALAAHIHEAPPGTGGPIAVYIDSLSTPPTGIGATSGSLVGDTVLDAGMVAAVTDSGSLGVGDSTPWYVNIHTAAHPGGEIRGQLIVSSVPLPGAVWLLISALGTFVGVRRFT